MRDLYTIKTCLVHTYIHNIERTAKNGGGNVEICELIVPDSEHDLPDDAEHLDARRLGARPSLAPKGVGLVGVCVVYTVLGRKRCFPKRGFISFLLNPADKASGEAN